MNCPRCARFCKNFTSLMAHGRTCCPNYIKQEWAGPGTASISELGFLQMRVKKQHGDLPDAMEGIEDYLVQLFEGSAAEPMTKTACGMCIGQLNDHIKAKKPPGPKDTGETMEVRDVRPGGTVIAQWVVPAGAATVSHEYPLGFRPVPPWERQVRLSSSDPWMTFFRETSNGTEIVGS
jgi:hypothetical protein